MMQEFLEINPTDYSYEARGYVYDQGEIRSDVFSFDWRTRRAASRIALEQDIVYQDYVFRLHGAAKEFNFTYPFPGAGSGLMTGRL